MVVMRERVRKEVLDQNTEQKHVGAGARQASANVGSSVMISDQSDHTGFRLRDR